MNTRNFIILMLAMIISQQLFAQKQPISLTGSVMDSASQAPVENVSFYITSNNNAVTSGLSKPGGTFRLSGLKALNYTLEVVAAGYNSKIIIVDLTDTVNRKTDLGVIYISPKIIGLKEVKVIARKPLVKQEIDRLTYDLQADPDSKANSVLEMMRKVPYLSLDADNNILLKGNTSYKIFINGRPSGMMERNAKEVLRSMPASTIQRIEVITNPPSKYDAEGLGGIINIVTNKKIANGYNGSLNISERFPVGGPGVGGSISIKEGKLGITAYGGGSIYNTPSTNNTVDRKTTGSSETHLLQDGSSRSNSKSGYVGTEVSLEIDSLNLMSVQLNVDGSNSDGRGSQLSRLNGKSAVIQAYDLSNVNDGHGSSMDASLNYQLGFKADKNKLLTFSYRYLKYDNVQNNLISIYNPINYNIPGYGQDNNTFSGEHTVQVDYVQQVKKLFIEAGVKGIFRNSNSDFLYSSFNAITGHYDADTSQLNQFDYTQNIFGAYNSYRYALKKWEFRAGVRVEQTVIDANFISTNTKVRQNYFNLMPSIAVQRKLNDFSNINLSFMQRIKRPGINRLNPFVDRSNPNFESSGNPELRPVVLNRVSIGYGISKKLSFNTGLDIGVVKKIDLKVSYFDPATNITRNTYQNSGDAIAFDYNANLSYPVTKRWNASVNSTLSFVHLEGYVNKSLIRNDYVLYNVSASSGYRFNKGWRVNANLNFIGPNPTGLQGTSNKLVTSSFSVNKELVKEKLSASAGFTNPFTQYRHNITRTYGPDFSEVIDNRNYFRSYNISLNYNFGKLKQAIKKNKRGIKNDDL